MANKAFIIQPRASGKSTSLMKEFLSDVESFKYTQYIYIYTYPTKFIEDVKRELYSKNLLVRCTFIRSKSAMHSGLQLRGFNNTTKIYCDEYWHYSKEAKEALIQTRAVVKGYTTLPSKFDEQDVLYQWIRANTPEELL